MTADNFLERLFNFFCDDAALTKEQVRAELKETGVDVDRFMNRIHSTIRKSLQSHWREQASAERASVAAMTDDLATKILAFPIEKLKQIVTEAEKGKFGSAGQELAIACRNKTEQELSIAELRALVQDILATAGNGEKAK